MKKIVILGAGTGGTIMANKLSRNLPSSVWEITVVDQHETHYYQPGFLFLPFQMYRKEMVVKPKRKFIPSRVKMVFAEINKVTGEKNEVLLRSGEVLPYDYLIIATGTKIVPAETPGMTEGLWHKKIFDFYTIEGAAALGECLKTWKGGELVISIADMPIKCPVAPLEFAMLADAYFVKKGMRDKVRISYVTPLSGAFTKPKSAKVLGQMLEKKDIQIVPDFYMERVDNDTQCLVSYDERKVRFDLLVTIPVHKGDPMVGRSGLGDDMDFAKADKFTLQSSLFNNIFVLGDAGNFPTSKAGSVVHFQAEVLEENILAAIERKPFPAKSDGHSNCYVESGFGKGALIDFNYDTEPLEGAYPLPFIGPFKLLKETRINHLGKLAFKWIYWNLLLPGRRIPVSNHMSMTGKKTQ
jgi:sulfide:quinone oxidoreductase